MAKSPVYVFQKQNMQPFPYTSENNPRPSTIPLRKGAGLLLNGFNPSPASLYQSGVHNIFHSPFSNSPVALQSNKRAHDSSFDQHNQVTQKRLKFSSPCGMPNESSTYPLGSAQLDSQSAQEESVGDILTRLFKEAEAEGCSTINPHQSGINQPLLYSEYSLNIEYTSTQLMPPDTNLVNSFISSIIPDRQKKIEMRDASANSHDEIGQNPLQYTHAIEHKTKEERLTDLKSKLRTSNDDIYKVVGEFFRDEKQLFVEKERVTQLQVVRAIHVPESTVSRYIQKYNAENDPNYVMQKIAKKYGENAVQILNSLKEEYHSDLRTRCKYEVIGEFFKNQESLKKDKKFAQENVAMIIGIDCSTLREHIKTYNKKLKINIKNIGL